MTTTRAALGVQAGEPCESRLPIVGAVPLQPLVAQVTRLIAAAEFLGAPLPPDHQRELEVAFKTANEASAVAAIQRVLDCHCLVGVEINPQMRVKVAPGPAKRELVEHGWRQFLVKVHNESGTTAVLRGISSQARRLAGAMPDELLSLWLDLQMFDSQPLTRTLSGLALEYRIVQLYSRDPGQREASLTFDVGQGTQDLGYRNEVPILFTIRPAETVPWRVRDETGAPTVAAFVIRDAQGRVYPSRAKRLAPDFAFHAQVYRADGEFMKLPAGTYTVEYLARSGIHYEDAAAHGSGVSRRCGRGEWWCGSGRELSNRTVDRSRKVRVVVGRPSHSRRGLRPLHESDRRRPPRGYGSPHAWRGLEGRGKSHLGSRFRYAETVLHR